MTESQFEYEIPQTPEGKIEYANRLKEMGNEFFKKGEYKQAIRRYKAIALYINGLGTDLSTAMAGAKGGPPTGKYAELITPIALSAALNLSACFIKLQEWEKGLNNAQKALKIEPTNEVMLKLQAAKKSNKNREKNLYANVFKKISEEGGLNKDQFSEQK
ncbi:peptidyl-prolyl cis-trans isomerase [Acrasis kona]|uniref:peptidylprolyl isomerase n=1 Tax=Acrasis kona TaxID=1008807 RepID=A0AAW2Z7A6_9EUKA